MKAAFCIKVNTIVVVLLFVDRPAVRDAVVARRPELASSARSDGYTIGLGEGASRRHTIYPIFSAVVFIDSFGGEACDAIQFGCRDMYFSNNQKGYFPFGSFLVSFCISFSSFATRRSTFLMSSAGGNSSGLIPRWPNILRTLRLF